MRTGCFSVFWSKLTPFGWYFRDVWEYEYGYDWALELCQDWFDYDGKRVNYAMDLEPTVPCPCTLDQALLDLGMYRSEKSSYLLIQDATCRCTDATGTETLHASITRDHSIASCLTPQRRNSK